MNYTILMLATLMVCSLPSVLGIVCKKCTPSQSPIVFCDRPEQITEVDCETLPSNSSEARFDSCTIAKVVANLGTTYLMECAIKDKSSDPDVVNCTSTKMRICADAEARVENIQAVTIISCDAKCCNTTNCNVQALLTASQGSTASATTASATTSNATTASATTASATTSNATTASTTTAKGGVSQIQPSTLLGFLLTSVTMLVKELD